MNATLDKPRLWSYREAARILGLSDANGYRLISELVIAHKITTTQLATAKGIDHAGLRVLARALNRTLKES